jgi:hypothetical protein
VLIRFLLAVAAVIALMWAGVQIAQKTETAGLRPAAVEVVQILAIQG